MNTDVESGVELAMDILNLSDTVVGIEKIVCPPFISITRIAQVLNGSSIQVGAQNVSENNNGAFTGEISASMLGGLTSHVIVGHSERRALNGETSDQIGAKAIAVADAGMVPILCVGEELSIRKFGQAVQFVSEQLETSLANFTNWASLIIAYEPVWAIGTGEAATSAQAQEMTAVCREVVRKLATEAADSIRILYGGSVNSGNVAELITQPDIDGALVGGASLKADEFSKLISAISSN
ncbi:MAG: triose-phosphate isomerase, partial [Chloroflexi bacterium]|nr:triose-phosphate isomerase [Chloroflexota bacterium]